MPTTRGYVAQVKKNNEIISREPRIVLPSAGFLYDHWLTSIKYRNAEFNETVYETEYRMQSAWYNDCEEMARKLYFDEDYLFKKYPELLSTDPELMFKVHAEFKKKAETDKLTWIFRNARCNPNHIIRSMAW